MKKIFYLIALCVAAWGLGSCESEPKNPGDFGVACEVTTGDVIVSLVNGKEYPIKIAREIDTVYQHAYYLRDTLKDEAGEPVKVNGKLQIHIDTLYYPSTYTAHYLESEPILLPPQPDTFRLQIMSNSLWLAPVPDNKGLGQWFFNHNTTTTGFGDGVFEFYTKENKGKERKNWAEQKIFSQDTTLMLNLVFRQSGLRD